MVMKKRQLCGLLVLLCVFLTACSAAAETEPVSISFMHGWGGSGADHVGMRELFAMQEDCSLILGAIGSQMRRLHYAKTFMACGKGQDTLMELTGLKSYPAGLTMTAARRASENFCRRAVELCLQTDVRMKTSFDDPERFLELLIVERAQEARRG